MSSGPTRSSRRTSAWGGSRRDGPAGSRKLWSRRDGGVLDGAAAVEVPVELLVPHGVGEVDEVHVSTDVGATSKRESEYTRRTRGHQE